MGNKNTEQKLMQLAGSFDLNKEIPEIIAGNSRSYALHLIEARLREVRCTVKTMEDICFVDRLDNDFDCARGFSLWVQP